MRQQRKTYFRLLVSVLVIIVCGSCHNDLKEIADLHKKQVLPEEGKQLEIYLSENARVKGKLTSPYMLRYQQADTPCMIFPKTLHVDFYNDSMQTETRMDALYGRYFTRLNKVYLRDTVVVISLLKGDTLHCEDLWWDQRTGNFTTDRPIRIYSKDRIIFGTSMVADQNFTHRNIKNVRGSLLTPANGLPQ